MQHPKKAAQRLEPEVTRIADFVVEETEEIVEEIKREEAIVERRFEKREGGIKWRRKRKLNRGVVQMDIA